MFCIDCGLLNSKERSGSVSAHHEPAQAILHLRFCNQQAENSCSSRTPKDPRAHGASTHCEMPCKWYYRYQLLTILSLGDAQDRSLLFGLRRILGREILVVLCARKRGCGFTRRSDQQGMAGNLRRCRISEIWLIVGLSLLTTPHPSLGEV